jgi:hypothetical protein
LSRTRIIMLGNRDRTPGQEHDLEDTFAGIAGRSINRLNKNGVSVGTASRRRDRSGRGREGRNQTGILVGGMPRSRTRPRGHRIIRCPSWRECHHLRPTASTGSSVARRRELIARTVGRSDALGEGRRPCGNMMFDRGRKPACGGGSGHRSSRCRRRRRIHGAMRRAQEVQPPLTRRSLTESNA